MFEKLTTWILKTVQTWQPKGVIERRKSQPIRFPIYVTKYPYKVEILENKTLYKKKVILDHPNVQDNVQYEQDY